MIGSCLRTQEPWRRRRPQRRTRPAPNLQPSAAPLGASNQPTPRPDPFAAYWALIPASRVGALAWAPPIFPSSNPFAFQNIPAAPPPFSLNSPRQFPSATPAPFDDVPPAAANGLFGNTIGKMLAARAKPYDPLEAAANGMWGGIAKMIAANAAPDPGARGFLGSLADLPVPPSAQAASYAPYSGPFLPLDPIGFQASSPPYLRNDSPTRTDPTEPIPNQPPPDQALAAPDAGREGRPNYLLIGDNEDEQEKERQKLDPWTSMGLPDVGPTTSPKALPTLPLVLPFSPRLLPPPTPVPAPPLRPPLPPASSLSPGTSPLPSTGPATNSPRASGAPIGPPSTVPPAPSPLARPTIGSGPPPGSSSQPASSLPEAGPSDPSASSPAISRDPKADLLQELFRRVGPGPFAPPNGGMPLSSPYGRGTTAEREQNDANGAEFGCHTFGTKNFGTSSGNPYLDHQPSKGLNPPPGASAEGYPHCVTCSGRQGFLVRLILQILGM
jgi:hypothetical protein